MQGVSSRPPWAPTSETAKRKRRGNNHVCTCACLLACQTSSCTYHLRKWCWSDESADAVPYVFADAALLRSWAPSLLWHRTRARYHSDYKLGSFSPLAPHPRALPFRLHERPDCIPQSPAPSHHAALPPQPGLLDSSTSTCARIRSAKRQSDRISRVKLEPWRT
jgi:hypothetical protein